MPLSGANYALTMVRFNAAAFSHAGNLVSCLFLWLRCAVLPACQAGASATLTECHLLLTTLLVPPSPPSLQPRRNELSGVAFPGMNSHSADGKSFAQDSPNSAANMA
jgi:hypothetical protein